MKIGTTAAAPPYEELERLIRDVEKRVAETLPDLPDAEVDAIVEAMTERLDQHFGDRLNYN